MKGQKGFTLVELLLYAALVGIVAVTALVFLSVLQSQRVRSQVILEVEEQGARALQIMTQTVRNATAIGSPTAGNTAAAVSLTVPTGSLSPTVFDLSAGALRVTEGASLPVALTSARVTVSGLTFTNLSRSGTPGTVRIQLTVSYNSSAGREYNYSKTFISSASIR